MLRLPRSRALRAVPLLVLLASCGGSDSPTNPPPAEQPDPNEVGSTGGTVTAQNGAVVLNVPAGAVSSNVTISVTPGTDPANDPNVVGGTVYQFGPSGTQFAQPVTLTLAYDAGSLPDGFPESALRIVTLTNGEWVPTGGEVTVDAANDRVTGTITSFSTKGVAVDPCALRDFGLTVSGTIDASDCSFSDESRTTWEEVYTVDVDALVSASGATVSGTPRFDLRLEAGFDARIGLQRAGSGSAGLVYDFEKLDVDPATGTAVIDLAVLAGESSYRLFVGGDDASDQGDYTLTTTVSDGTTYRPEAGPPVIAGNASFASTVGPLNAFEGTVNVGPAQGERLWYQYWFAKLEEGMSYRLALAGLPSGSRVGAFVGASPLSMGVDQVLDVGVSDDDPDREVAFTATRTGYYYIEVSTTVVAQSDYSFEFGPVTGYDPCGARPLAPSVTANLSAFDCGVEVEGGVTFEDVYALRPAEWPAGIGNAPQRIDIQVSAGFEGTLGVRRTGDDLVLGTRDFDASTGRTLSVLALGGDFEVFVRGATATNAGSYTLQSSARPIQLECSTSFLVTPDELVFEHRIRADNACSGTVTFGEFVGEPLRYQYAYVRLEAGKSYDLATSGYDPAAPFAFFTRGLSEEGSELLQFPDGTGTLSRRITPAVTGYWYLEWSVGGANPPDADWSFRIRALN